VGGARTQKEQVEEPEEEVVTRQTFVFSATLALPAELRRRLNLKVNPNKKKADKTMMETLMACVAHPVALPVIAVSFATLYGSLLKLNSTRPREHSMPAGAVGTSFLVVSRIPLAVELAFRAQVSGVSARIVGRGGFGREDDGCRVRVT
jgi:hypothetical protein